MTASEYCHALRLVNSAIALCGAERHTADARRAQLRKLFVEAILLRVRLGQPAAPLQRN